MVPIYRYFFIDYFSNKIFAEIIYWEKHLDKGNAHILITFIFLLFFHLLLHDI